MGEYPGASWSGVSPNKSPRQGRVQLFIVHHWAGGYNNPAAAAVGQRNVFMSANSRDVSPNWQVNYDGSVWEIVPPTPYRAWTTGSIDNQAVTVETQNVSGAPNWGISSASHEAIAHLVAWASKKYGFPIQRGRVNSDNSVAVPGVLGHNETPAGKSTGTACPGPSMDLNWIVRRAQEIASGVAPTPDPENEEIEMNTVIYWNRSSDGAATYALINTDSGYVSQWIGSDSAYNSRFAAAFRTGNFLPVTESHARNLIASALDVAPSDALKVEVVDVSKESVPS